MLNQTQGPEDIRWYRAHGWDALGASHVSGLGLVHLLLLHLERTQVNWQGATEKHVYLVYVGVFCNAKSEHIFKR